MGRREALTEKFRVVCGARLGKLAEGLAALAADASDEEARDGVERELHTLKGEASLLGFSAIARVAQALERRLGSATPARFVPAGAEGERWAAGLALIERLRLRAPDDAEGQAAADAFVSEAARDTPPSGTPS